MAGPEMKQVQEAADAFKDDKINKIEANKIADALDPAKTKPTDIQEFIKDSKTYPTFLDGIINNIENYTKVDAINFGNTVSLEKKLQIEDNNIPLKQLSKEEKDKILNDAKNFLLRLKDEKRKLSNTTEKNANDITPPQEKEKDNNNTSDKVEIKYDADKPLESMLLTINENFKQAKVEDKKLVQTPEQIQANAEKIRNNLKDGIMKQVETELKSLLKIKDKKLNDEYDNKKEAIYKFLYESFVNELNTGKRIDNLVVGGLYVTINGIKQKMDAPNKENLKDFNLVGANILSNVKDINALLSANGNVMDNLFKNSQDKIVKKIKATFPREAITRMTEQELNTELGNIKQKGFYINLGKASNPVTEVFSKDITIDSELSAIQFIESNNGLPKTTKEQIGGEGGAEVQKDLANKIKDILSAVPTTEYEKGAFKTELIQNKFSGWSKALLETIYNLAQKRGFGDLLNMFNKDGLFEKVLLSKSRNDALIAKDVYIKNKGGREEKKFTTTKEYKQEIKDIATTIDITGVTNTLNDCKKFISPVVTNGNSETEDKQRAKDYMGDTDTYNSDLVTAQFDKYVGLLSEKWENPITRIVEEDKLKIKKIYSYKDLIKSDADLVEHFMQYVQTGKMPDGYADKTIYENMKDLGKVPEIQQQGTKSPEQAPTTTKDNAVDTPVKVEAPVAEKPREKAANDFATSVKGKAFPSKLWTDSYAVEYTINGKKAVKMFKSSTAQKISK